MTYKFKTSNNETEYETIIAGLQLADSLKVGKLRGEFVVKEEAMILYKDVTEGLLARLSTYEIHYVPRAENKEADILSKLALEGVPNHIAMMCLMEEVEMPNTEMLAVCPVTTDQPARPTGLTKCESKSKWVLYPKIKIGQPS